MRYVEAPELSHLGDAMSRTFQDVRLTSGIELFTTKQASSDRRLQRTLDKQLDEAVVDIDATSLGHSHLLSPPASIEKKRRANSATLPISPFGPMDQSSNRKQYAYLISVLNASDPDRDFSALHPDNFERERSPTRVANMVTNALLSYGMSPPPNLWEVINREIDLRDCKIYSLTLPQQFLEDDDSGVAWAQMLFFFNKRRKRVIFMHLTTRLLSPMMAPSVPGNEDYDTTLDDEVVGVLDQ